MLIYYINIKTFPFIVELLLKQHFHIVNIFTIKHTALRHI